MNIARSGGKSVLRTVGAESGMAAAVESWADRVVRRKSGSIMGPHGSTPDHQALRVSTSP